MIDVQVTQNFDPRVLDFLWKHPQVYSFMGDDFLPPPEQISLADMSQAVGVSIFVAYVDSFPVGAVSYRRQPSFVCHDIHCGFIPNARGALAKTAIAKTIDTMFEKGALKIVAQATRSQKPVLFLAASLGFQREGVNRLSVVKDKRLVDQIYLGLTKDVWNRRSSLRQ